jgi:hypothetical protein
VCLGWGSRRWARKADWNTKNKLLKLVTNPIRVPSLSDFEPPEVETIDWNTQTFSNSTSKSPYERMGPDIYIPQFSRFSYVTDMQVTSLKVQKTRLRCFKCSFTSSPTRSVDAIGNMSFGAILIIYSKARPT